MNKLRALFFILLLIASPVSSQSPCTTHTSYVSCMDCPNPSLYMCWGSSNSTYSVWGTPEETWCNWTYHSGWCTAYLDCTTVSMITVSVDCEGERIATQWTLCCAAP